MNDGGWEVCSRPLGCSVTLRRPSCLLVGQTRLSWRSAGDSSDQKIVTAEELYEDFTPNAIVFYFVPGIGLRNKISYYTNYIDELEYLNSKP